MQFKFSIQCSNSQVTISDFIKGIFLNHPSFHPTVQITEDIEFQDFTGDLHEFELNLLYANYAFTKVTGLVVTEVISSAGDDDFYDYIPDLMSQFRQFLTQALNWNPGLRCGLKYCIGIYNYLLQFQGDEDDTDALFENQGLEPIEMPKLTEDED